ncbi:HAD superfamily hydrolase (TIGR01509 family)/HAD superfamily hydrolase (TIGR01549 family) [Saccharothrix carnea]|uniref:D,D-heptose 1,7-bisphosphate phosphatase n=1 Tax=Saccharothrix carnea TaxID=1280637 RepID=A0A2P8I5S4_SACCR|nr:HAD family hydrolase [Saccharothrix carnea]PSL53821.1 HAD superfamily hydrolase (TIGR01509 family)/HAD superfamily hydrolase (TIGR01549 family) [Saccharothrix carnea]
MDQYPDAVLFDRDGTLIKDVPYNGDPDRVEPMPGAREVLRVLRARGVRTGVVSNQSGIARGLLTRTQVDAVNSRVEALLGRFGTWQVCPHGPDDGCACRKPAPTMILQACEALQVRPERTFFIGDIEADVEAALAAGATPILVPTPATLPDEVDRAPHTAPDLRSALAMVL